MAPNYRWLGTCSDAKLIVWYVLTQFFLLIQYVGWGLPAIIMLYEIKQVKGKIVTGPAKIGHAGTNYPAT